MINKIKKIIWILIITIFIFFGINFFSNNVEKESIKMDNKKIAVFIDNKKVITGIPSKESGYVFDKYVCSDNNTLIEWDSSNRSYSANNIASSISCSLYFIEKVNIVNNFAYSGSSQVWKVPIDGIYSIELWGAGNAYTDANYSGNSGWRVLSINGIGLTGTVTLIHAGTSECCCVYEGQSSNGIAQLNNLCNAFINSRFASYGRSINCNDIKAYNGNACNSNIKPKPTIINNIIKTGSYYWLSSADGPDYLWAIDYSGYVTNGLRSKCLGVRPVIVLKSGIKNSGGQGTNESPFIISN